MMDGVQDSDAFSDAAACLWTEEQRAPTEEVIEKTMPYAQRLVNRRQKDAQRKRLMAMFNIHDPHSLEGAQAAARIRSCSGGAASAYIEMLPLTHNLRMAHCHLTYGLRFRNGIQTLPADNAGKRCPCSDMLSGMRDADYALTCPKHRSLRTLRHDYLNKAGAMQRAAPGGVGGGAKAERVADAARCTPSREHPRRRTRRRIAGRYAGD